MPKVKDYIRMDRPLLTSSLTPVQWRVLEETPLCYLFDALLEHKGGVRAVNVIQSQGHTTLADVAKTPAHEWMRYRNFGRTSLQLLTLELERALNKIFWADGSRADTNGGSTRPNGPSPLVTVPADERTDLWDALTTIPVSDEIASSLLDAGWSEHAVSEVLNSSCTTLADFARTHFERWVCQPGFNTTALVEMKAALRSFVAQQRLDDGPSMRPGASGGNDEAPDCKTPESLEELAEWALGLLDERQARIIGLYFGRGGETHTLQEIGDNFGLSRERVRQLKSRANQRLQQRQRIFEKFVASLAEETVVTALEYRGGIAPITALRTDVANSWADAPWADAWFKDAFGPQWFFLGSGRYEVDSVTCALCGNSRGRTLATEIAKQLRLFGYAPLTLSACVSWYNAEHKESLTPHEMRAALEVHPDLCLFEYGETYIGLNTWDWFDAKFARHKRSVEWVLRLLNIPTSPEVIADALRKHCGILDADPFLVAETCEADTETYFAEENSYGLQIWRRAQSIVEDLNQILRKGPLQFEMIVDRFDDRNYPSIAPEHVAAALQIHPERFARQNLRTWSLAKENEHLDLSLLSFDDLIPD